MHCALKSFVLSGVRISGTSAAAAARRSGRVGARLREITMHGIFLGQNLLHHLRLGLLPQIAQVAHFPRAKELDALVRKIFEIPRQRQRRAVDALFTDDLVQPLLPRHQFQLRGSF